MESCSKHPHEIGVALCDRCGQARCSDCLVYARGDRKPPYCMECAMFVGGVRSAAPRPALSRREMKARRKELERAEQERQAPVEEPSAAAVEVEQPTTAPASDWSTPWWEDRQPTLAD